MENDPAPRRAPVPPSAPVTVIGSGKGGVGKSLLAAMLAASHARCGRRTLLVDADHNLANLHVLLGVEPTRRLEEVARGLIGATDLMVQVDRHLWLLPGDSGSPTLQGAGPIDRARLYQRITAAYDPFDIVVVDAGAGLDGVVRACAVAASELMLVTMPEPAALTDAYAVAKVVHLQVPEVPVGVLVNRARTEAEGREAWSRIQTAGRRFLRRDFPLLAVVTEDPVLHDIVRAGRPLLAATADRPITATMNTIAHHHEERSGFSAFPVEARS